MPQYPELRKVLGGPYRGMPAQQIESMLEDYNVNAEDMESFLSTLGDIGRGVVRALPQVLPAALPIAGTVLGGPLGGMLGGMAGQALGSALGPRPAAPPLPGAPQPAGGQAPAPGGYMPAPMPGGSPAAGQLLQTMFRPETLQALISMLMGQVGRQSVPVGNTQVPLGGFPNLLGVLANQAAAEYDAASAHGYGSETLPRYLENYAGESYGDPSVPEHRAAALLELFRESDVEHDEAAPSMPVSSYESYESDPELDEIYDAMDLAELNAEYEFA